MKQKTTKISFGESVKKLSYEQFMARFQPIYPDADLHQYAAQLGIEVPVAIVVDEPASGPKKLARSKRKKKNDDEDQPGNPEDPANERTGAGQGEHEADEEGLR